MLLPRPDLRALLLVVQLVVLAVMVMAGPSPAQQARRRRFHPSLSCHALAFDPDRPLLPPVLESPEASPSDQHESAMEESGEESLSMPALLASATSFPCPATVGDAAQDGAPLPPSLRFHLQLQRDACIRGRHRFARNPASPSQRRQDTVRECGHIFLAMENVAEWRNAKTRSAEPGRTMLYFTEGDPVSPVAYHLASSLVHRAQAVARMHSPLATSRLIAKWWIKQYERTLETEQQATPSPKSTRFADYDDVEVPFRPESSSAESSAESAAESSSPRPSTASPFVAETWSIEDCPEPYIHSYAYGVLKLAHRRLMQDMLGIRSRTLTPYARTNFLTIALDQNTGRMQSANVGYAGFGVYRKTGSRKMSAHPSRTEPSTMPASLRNFSFESSGESPLPNGNHALESHALSDDSGDSWSSVEGSGSSASSSTSSSSSSSNASPITPRPPPSLFLASDVPAESRPESALLDTVSLEHDDILVLASQSVWRWLSDRDIQKVLSITYKHRHRFGTSASQLSPAYYHYVERQLMLLVRERANLAGDIANDFRLVLASVVDTRRSSYRRTATL